MVRKKIPHSILCDYTRFGGFSGYFHTLVAFCLRMFLCVIKGHNLFNQG